MNTKKEMQLTYIVECFICETAELAVRAELPNGWKKVKGYAYHFCPECAKKLRESIENERISVTSESN